MGRPPKGDRAMTATERHQRHMARKLAAAVAAAPAPPASAATSEPYLKFVHLKIDPTRTAQSIYQRIGYDAAVAFHRALGQVIEANRPPAPP